MRGRGGADEAHGHEAGVLRGRSLGGCEGAHTASSPPVVLLGALSGLDVYLHLELLEALVIRGRSFVLGYLILQQSQFTKAGTTIIASCELDLRCTYVFFRAKSIPLNGFSL